MTQKIKYKNKNNFDHYNRKQNIIYLVIRR